jgi:hypothetical protein
MTIDPANNKLEWTPDTPGLFDVSIVATNITGEDREDFAITVNDTVIDFIKKQNEKLTLVIYPVPANDLLWWSIEEEITGPLQINMINVLGEEIYSEYISSRLIGKLQQVNTGNFNPGIYFFCISTDKATSVKKIIIRR